MKKIVAELFERPITKEQRRHWHGHGAFAFALQRCFQTGNSCYHSDRRSRGRHDVSAALSAGGRLVAGPLPPVGIVVSKILLTLVFFGVVTPIGLARKFWALIP